MQGARVGSVVAVGTPSVGHRAPRSAALSTSSITVAIDRSMLPFSTTGTPSAARGSTM